MRRILNSTAVLAALAFASCQDTKTTQANTENRARIEVTHLSGKTEVLKNPKQVVVLDFGMVDSFEKLGLNLSGASLGVVPDYLSAIKDNPAYVHVGDIKTPNVEKINALEPELILISSRQVPMYEELSKIAPTLNLNIDEQDYWTSFKENHRTIGTLFDVEEQVEEELSRLEKRIEAIRAQTSNSDKKALIVLTNEGRMSSYGSGSRFGIIHDVFGMQEADPKIEASTHGQSLSNELIQELNPDYIFVIDRGTAIKRNSMEPSSFVNPLIEQTNAFKDNKIVFLSADVWYLAGGGIQSLDLMIDEMEKALQ